MKGAEEASGQEEDDMGDSEGRKHGEDDDSQDSEVVEGARTPGAQTGQQTVEVDNLDLQLMSVLYSVIRQL